MARNRGRSLGQGRSPAQMTRLSVLASGLHQQTAHLTLGTVRVPNRRGNMRGRNAAGVTTEAATRSQMTGMETGTGTSPDIGPETGPMTGANTGIKTSTETGTKAGAKTGAKPGPVEQRMTAGPRRNTGITAHWKRPRNGTGTMSSKAEGRGPQTKALPRPMPLLHVPDLRKCARSLSGRPTHWTTTFGGAVRSPGSRLRRRRLRTSCGHCASRRRRTPKAWHGRARLVPKQKAQRPLRKCTAQWLPCSSLCRLRLLLFRPPFLALLDLHWSKAQQARRSGSCRRSFSTHPP
jgi:hypothetical protein